MKKSYSDKNTTDITYKILLLGDSSVGKTCLLLRYCDNTYNTGHIATIGLDYRFKTIDFENLKLKLQIWDTAGQDRFRSITQSYYKGAHGVLLVYDVTSRESFNNVKTWISQIREHSPKNITLFLIGNKIDSVERQVEKEEVEEFAKENNCTFIEASAKENINVKEAFEELYKTIYSKNLEDNSSTEQIKKKLSLDNIKKKKGKCCKN